MYSTKYGVDSGTIKHPHMGPPSSWEGVDRSKLENETNNLMKWISIARPSVTESKMEFCCNPKRTYSKVSLIFSAPIVSSINQEEPDVNALIVSRKTSVIRELTSAVQNLSLKSAMNVDSEGMRHTNVWDY
ncbi:hypothetical protein RF11_02679 [Thelohanellus kitauei]|uniref:Uncharacterized protein n=1 Tax=Thelohanellus kitauei TaxID=669202 RepID=A0A0C2MB01_THEKT|nr:hypothetical protein RF11_02679 [Thelohanellus kitauei]